jgi:hypothetical protein
MRFGIIVSVLRRTRNLQRNARLNGARPCGNWTQLPLDAGYCIMISGTQYGSKETVL